MADGCLNKLSLEAGIQLSEPTDGFREDRIIFKQADWLTGGTDVVLTGATTPARAALTVDSVVGTTVVQWAANAAATVLAGTQFVVPHDYNFAARDQGGRLTNDFVLNAVMRRQRNAADTGAWAARCTVYWWRPGTDSALFRLLATNPTVAIPTIAADNTATLTGFSTLTFDIGARLRAEGFSIQAGDVVRLLIGPDAQNANAILQLAGATVRLRRNIGLTNRSLR